MNKTDLIKKIKTLEGFTNEERADLIEIINTKKRYGLVWEDKAETVEEQLRQSLPVLKEVIEKRILGADVKTKSALENPRLFENANEKDATNEIPNHVLIEGDNLHALTALSFTHENKIDVIYIDPPYNTGNKDFKYNDTYVDKEDSFRHSKWLSFMSKRLEIAKRLLSDKGAIFISIDENEISELKLLCNEIFGSNNFITQITLLCNPKGRSQDKYFNTSHEYCLVFSKAYLNPGHFSINKNEEDVSAGYKLKDHIGKYRLLELRNTHREFNKTNRPNLFYTIYVDPASSKVSLAQDQFYTISVEPLWSDDFEGCWTWGKELFKKDNQLLVGLEKKGVWKVYRKSYSHSDDGQIVKKKLFTIWNDSSFFTERGQTSFGDIFPGLNKNDFPQPKAAEYVKQIITSGSNLNSTILDFFAGSGTTLQSTMQLNAEDGGNRQCILVTNNENKICEDITYVRNKKIIEGYTNAKGVEVEGLTNNNFRYYKSEFVPSQKSEINKRLLTHASTDLLCIKENCYIDITAVNGLNPTQCKVLTNGTNKYLIIVFHCRQPLLVYAQLVAYIKAITILSEKIRLYGFSPEKETLYADFIEVADKIDAVPLPDAIYNAYRATFNTMRMAKKVSSMPVQDTTYNTNPASLTPIKPGRKAIAMQADFSVEINY